MQSGTVVRPLLRVVFATDGSCRWKQPTVSVRPPQPEPFLRGAPYLAAGDDPYPRADPADTPRLPADTWHSALIPAGVRFELVGDAEAVDIAYRTTSGNLGYRGDGAGVTFSVWRGGSNVWSEEAVLGDGLVRLPLGSSPSGAPATIYLPEGMHRRPVPHRGAGGDHAGPGAAPMDRLRRLVHPGLGGLRARARGGRPSRPEAPDSTW